MRTDLDNVSQQEVLPANHPEKSKNEARVSAHIFKNMGFSVWHYVTFTITFAVAIALPVSLLAWASFVAAKYNKASFVDNFTRFGYAIIAFDLAAHIAHNLFHLLAEGKSILYTGMALFGVESHGASPALAGMATIQTLQFSLLGLGFLGSLYIVYRTANFNYQGEVVWATFKPYAVLMGCLGILNVVLFTLPMSMRM